MHTPPPGTAGRPAEQMIDGAVPVSEHPHKQRPAKLRSLQALPLLQGLDPLIVASIQPWLDGTQPLQYSFTVKYGVHCEDLIPPGFEMVRSITFDNRNGLHATSPAASVTILESVIGTIATITATDQAALDEAVAAVRAREDQAHAPPEPTASTPGTHPTGINFWAEGKTWHRKMLMPTWDSIRRNYPTPVAERLDALAKLQQPDAQGRLLLWHGPPGTGKTTAVRSLIDAWRPWCRSNYIVDPDLFFEKPGYLLDVTMREQRRIDDQPPGGATWSLLICEDSDEYLRSTARREAGAALGRVLNLTDGILGQTMNLLLLLTTNEDLARLHPAVTRPGRCLAEIDFRAFEPREAATWLDDGAHIRHPMTLAELLAHRGDIGDTGESHRRQPLTTGAYL